jgi:hypothetical protein
MYNRNPRDKDMSDLDSAILELDNRLDMHPPESRAELDEAIKELETLIDALYREQYTEDTYETINSLERWRLQYKNDLNCLPAPEAGL